MSEIVRVYKVLARIDGVLSSVMIDRGVAKKIYRKDAWNHPSPWLAKKGYGLFAFTSLERANAFAMFNKRNPYCDVWAADGVLFGELPKYRSCNGLRYLSDKILPDLEFQDWPSSTVCCKRLKLVRCLVKGELSR